MKLTRMLVMTHLAASMSEARRLIKQGAIHVNEILVTDPDAEIVPDANSTGLTLVHVEEAGGIGTPAKPQ